MALYLVHNGRMEKNNMSNSINIKSLRAATRELELELLRKHGPQHGKAATMQSKRDKARSPRLQRKHRNWLRDGH